MAAEQEAIPGVIAPGARLERVATGFGFTEGPIWHPSGHWLMFSDIAESRQWRWTEAEGLSPFRQPSNQSNGNCFDLAGRVVSCEHASSQLVLHDHGGKLVRVLARSFEGRALNSPNDVVCDRAGRLWFTDPTYGRTREDLGILREPELDFRGVYRLDPDGTLACVARDFEQPNGLCFDLAEARLFVNDTEAGVIRVFDLEPGGALSGGAVWARVEGEGEGRADGMKLDVVGRVFCNGPGGVHVYDPEGAWLGRIATPEKSTNFCFGGAERRALFVTASTSIYRIETETAGLPMIH